MSNTLQYTLSLNDQISAKLQKIGVSSNNALDKFSKLQLQSKKTSQLLKDMGGSVGSLREKLNLLKSEKEWIPASNLTSIRKYNTEIKNLEKEILKLDTINGSAFKRNLKGAINNLPFADLITNPVAQAGVALFQSGKMALDFNEGMVKINTTAQLNSDGLNKLKDNLISMGRDAGADLATVPDAFEKILSQTNDVALSQDILKMALKGSKAGFTDLDTVSAAVAQTLSLVGKENTNAQEVMDTLFAAKRVGAGEFKDFANYVPGLVASGQALGKGFQETAGVFAYMTGKGQSAEASAMLIQNAYTALGKGKITSGLQKTGVAVFNKDGSMKSLDQIFGALEKKMKKFGGNDKAKSKYLEGIGLVDAQAKQAFMVLSSGGDKLKQSMDAVKNSTGETDKAFANAQNPMMRIQKLWSDIQSIGLSLGDVLGIVLVPVFGALSIIVGTVSDSIGWFSTQIQNGNPWILGLIGIIGLLTIANYAVATAEAVKDMWAKRSLITTKLQSVWAWITTGATNAWAAATWLLNTAILSIPMAIIAIIAVIAYVIYAFDGWGNLWKHTVNSAKFAWAAFVADLKLKWLGIESSFMIGINKIKAAWYGFKNAVGLGNKSENNAAIAQINADTEARKKAYMAGQAKVKLLNKSAAVEAIAAVNSLHSNGKGFGTMVGDIKKTLGLEDKGIKKVKGAPVNPKDPNGDPTNPTGPTNEAIATGGTKNNVINITINELNGIKTAVIEGSKDIANKAGAGIADEILRVLAMANTATG
ncbi:MAG: phage tail tape measure protein [Flavobacterium sp.]|nr:phage tail tape measure protein [Flavobacterium sp.]